MALYVDDQQQSQHKHFCRICKKSFACGQALGGHMRAHGISENISYMDDDDEEEEEEDHMSNGWAPNANTMYSLRTNPNRLKSCRVCENCGIEFSSWKSFLEHGKCNLEEAESEPGGSEFEEELPRRDYNYNSSKRKRSYRAKVGSIINYNSPSSEEEELAHCLMMLSKGIADSSSDARGEESFASASKNEGSIHHLSPYNNHGYKISNQHQRTKLEIPKIVFECKACKKVFNSHQALGGHRASHKKVKGCFASKLDDHTNDNEAEGIMVTQDHESYPTKLQYCHNNGSSLKEKKKEKVHECSICYRVFSSGQALGGHKRCHWITSKNSTDSVVKFDHNNRFYDQAHEVVAVNNLSKDSKTVLDLSFHALDAKSHNNKNSQEMFLLPWTGDDKVFTSKVKDDETETKTKFDTLTELKETSSQWLQIGLGSTSSQVGSD